MPELVLKARHKILNKIGHDPCSPGESQRIKDDSRDDQESHDDITSTARLSVIKKVHSLNIRFSK